MAGRLQNMRDIRALLSTQTYVNDTLFIHFKNVTFPFTSVIYSLEDFNYSSQGKTRQQGWPFWAYYTETRSLLADDQFKVLAESYLMAVGLLFIEDKIVQVRNLIRSSDPDDERLDDAIPVEMGSREY